MKYRAVFLDAGETILAPHPSFVEVFVEVMSGRGNKLAAAEVEEAFRDAGPSFGEAIRRIGVWSVSKETSRRFWREVYQTALARLGVSDDDGGHFEALYERFTRYDSYRLFPEVVAALHEIKDAGIALGLISNFEEWLEDMLAEWEVAPLFDVLVISGKEGIEKPDPDIFNRALERANVSAPESVYVGDNPTDDIEAAERVGMSGILMDRRDRFPNFQGRRIRGLDALPRLLGIG